MIIICFIYMQIWLLFFICRVGAQKLFLCCGKIVQSLLGCLRQRKKSTWRSGQDDGFLRWNLLKSRILKPLTHIFWTGIPQKRNGLLLAGDFSALIFNFGLNHKVDWMLEAHSESPLA